MSGMREQRFEYTAIGKKTITSTDVNGEEIKKTQEVKATRTAEDAKVYVDPEKVKTAITKVNETSEKGVKKIQDSVRNVSVDADRNMLSVEDATMEPIISQYADSISDILVEISSAMEQVQEFADTEFDKKQKEYNTTAKEAAINECADKGGTNITTTAKVVS